jgi:hypothetical protein
MYNLLGKIDDRLDSDALNVVNHPRLSFDDTLEASTWKPRAVVMVLPTRYRVARAIKYIFDVFETLLVVFVWKGRCTFHRAKAMTDEEASGLRK